MSKRRLKPICDNCDSDDITYVYVAKWDIEKQKPAGFTPTSESEIYCANCAGEDIKMVEVEAYSKDREYWESSSRYPVEDWIYEVSNGDTRHSYAEWLFQKLSEDKNDE